MAGEKKVGDLRRRPPNILDFGRRRREGSGTILPHIYTGIGYLVAAHCGVGLGTPARLEGRRQPREARKEGGREQVLEVC